MSEPQQSPSEIYKSSKTLQSPSEIYNSTPSAQKDYDAFNELIFSSERNIIFKFLTRHELYNRIKHLPGNIVEVGVFKGAGLCSWLKFMAMDAPFDGRKCLGMDMFNPGFVDNLSSVDKSSMQQVFTRCNATSDDVSKEAVEKKLLAAGFSKDKFELIAGDVSETSRKFVLERPGFRISLLYMDVDLEKPTYDTLVNFWDRVVPGGIIVFDEYNYDYWSESNAVDRFVKEKGLILHKTNVKSPTAYIVK